MGTSNGTSSLTLGNDNVPELSDSEASSGQQDINSYSSRTSNTLLIDPQFCYNFQRLSANSEVKTLHINYV
jgi:hypothetical protein